MAHGRHAAHRHSDKERNGRAYRAQLRSCGWNHYVAAAGRCAGDVFSDFGHPWRRGRLPPEANVSEMIVGILDMERRMGERVPAEELNQKVAEYAAENSLPRQREVTEDDLSRVRATRADVFAKWDAVRPGDALEVPFEVAHANLRDEAAPSLHRSGAT